MIYNEFCTRKACGHCITWNCQFDPNCEPYPATSCQLVGQSYDIDKYPESCEYLDEIKEYEKNYG